MAVTTFIRKSFTGKDMSSVLSKDQSEAFGLIQHWLEHSKSREFTLGGYAGTGKTFLMKYVVDYCDDNNIPVVATAPTNEALKVLSEKCEHNFNKTIYGLMGLVLKEERGEAAELHQEGRNSLNDYELVIIDEASMVSDMLFDKIRKNMKLFKRYKVLYVGDPIQLPPVDKESEGDELDVKSKPFTDVNDTYTLTKIQRQAEGSPTIRLVTKIRNHYLEKGDHIDREDMVTDEGTVRFVDDKEAWKNEMVEHFASDEFRLDDRHVKALAYTNAEVDELNAFIRPHIYGKDHSEYEVGERLICGKTVMDAKGKEIIYTTNERLYVMKAVKSFDSKNPDFKYWVLDVRNVFNKAHTINVVARESMPYYKAVLKSIADSARAAKGSKGVKGIWSMYYSLQQKFADVKYAYAMTVHCSQGSTIKHVYVNEKDLNRLRWNHVERNKLKYVAMTRTSGSLVIHH